MGSNMIGEGDWKYITNGAVTHWVGSGDAVAPCGKGPLWFDPSGWMGTGTQREYEKAAKLPRCKTCIRLRSR